MWGEETDNVVPGSRNQRNVRSSVVWSPSFPHGKDGGAPHNHPSPLHKRPVLSLTKGRGIQGDGSMGADHECIPNTGQTLCRGFPQSGTSRLMKRGSAVPACPDTRDLSGLPGVWGTPPNPRSPPFLARPVLSLTKGRGPGRWSKEFFSTLLGCRRHRTQIIPKAASWEEPAVPHPLVT